MMRELMPMKNILKSNRLSSTFITLAMLLLLSGCLGSDRLGEKGNPIKLLFTPATDAEVLGGDAPTFIKFLEQETGLYFKSGIPGSYISMLDMFAANKADIAMMNAFAYLIAHRRYGVEAKFKAIRYGQSYYRGQIIANHKSGVKKVQDLNGKRFAFTDPTSTTGHMFPLKLIKDHNITLATEIFAKKHDVVVSMVYRGEVDAGATYYFPPSPEGKIRDARIRVLEQLPDVAQRVKIVTITEKIPNDPLVFRKGLPRQVIIKFKNALFRFLSEKGGKHIFNSLYGVEGWSEATDQDYDGLREMVKKIDLNQELMLPKL
jgi:phosphonate transport system substrate-binding protein